MKVPPPEPTDHSIVVGYTRVSTGEQAESGAGLEAQAATISSYCSNRGWTLYGSYTDAGVGGGSLDRPALAGAIDALDAGAASALVVSKVDRLSRSVLDFSMLLARAQRGGWKIVAIDLGLDMTTPSGTLLAGIMAQIAQYERSLIGQRTRDALAVRKAAGIRLGRPRSLDPDVAERIRLRRRQGATLRAIAEELNDASIPTASGRLWSPALVRKIDLQDPAP